MPRIVIIQKSPSFTIMRRIKSTSSNCSSNSNSNSNSSSNNSNNMTMIHDALEKEKAPLMLPYASQDYEPPLTMAASDTESDSDDDGIVTSARLSSSSSSSKNSMLMDDWSQWANSLGLPLTMYDCTPLHAHAEAMEHSTTNLHTHTVPRTKSRFQPSYLLQKRKQALLQLHQQHASSLPSLYHHYTKGVVGAAAATTGAWASRRQSCLALLFLISACCALFCLSHSSTGTYTTATATTTTAAVVPGVPTSSTSHFYTPTAPITPSTTFYYLNMRQDQPLEIIALLLVVHAKTFALPNAQFAGICGYPTYQQEAQQQAIKTLVQLRLETILPTWDTCPPLDAILQDDPHYVLVEEEEVERNRHLLFTPEWKQWMQQHRQQRKDSNTINMALLQQHVRHQQDPQQKQDEEDMYESLWQLLIGGTTPV